MLIYTQACSHQNSAQVFHVTCLTIMCVIVSTSEAPDQNPARRNASIQRRGELVGSKSEHQVQLAGVPFDTTEDEIRQFLTGKEERKFFGILPKWITRNHKINILVGSINKT